MKVFPPTILVSVNMSLNHPIGEDATHILSGKR